MGDAAPDRLDLPSGADTDPEELMRICTIVARNYLAQARVLAASLQRLDEVPELSVLVLDDEDDEVDESRELFDVVRPRDLDIEPREFHHMATIYDVTELATAVKPWLLQRMLVSHEVVCYLDPDIEVFSSLDEIELQARLHSIVLTPHTTRPMPRDGLLPSEQTIRLAGVFNLGFIAVSRGADEFLSWWSERLRRECRIAVDQGLFVDQRWIDFVPSYFDHAVLHDVGYNVAYWNMHEREVKLGSDGYEVNGRPLRFLHYSGFEPLRPHLLSKYQGGEPRILLEDHYEIAHLCYRYATRLFAAGHLEATSSPYRFDYTAQGMRIDGRMRRLYAAALAADEAAGTKSRLPDPFTPVGAELFLSWLSVPAPSDAPARVSRYLRAVYEERGDLAAHFGDLSGPGGEEYLEWVRMHGRAQAGVPGECVPPPVASWRARPRGLAEGVNLVGYLRAEDGVGEVARATLDVIRRAGTAVSIRNCTETGSRQCAAVDDARPDVHITYDTTIACINADQFPLLAAQMRDLMPVAASTIGIWAWEVDIFPHWMANSASLVDEIWTYSAHGAAAIQAACPVPVHVFAPPVKVPERVGDVDRAAFGVTDDFTFLTCFDFRSVFDRKNPLGVIDAFTQAFAPGDGPRLVIKCVNGGAVPRAFARMQAAVADRPDIEVRDGYEPEARQRGLTAACDCYVSLHRAEGYGLVLAEAMAAAKPVIATAYSGNLEFMTPETSVLVPYELARIPFACGPYPHTASWAEPDLEVAARSMRELASDPAAAAQLGATARAHIARHHTAEARVEFVRARLHALRSNR
jgi:glycosyltransferase involved in cell wall biosynthesis